MPFHRSTTPPALLPRARRRFARSRSRRASPLAPRIVASLAAVLALGVGCDEDVPLRPSLLLITTSGLRADALPCYEGAEAPGASGAAICGLADRGALFVWAFTTTPEVAPSAATLLASQYPHEHGVATSAATFLRTGTRTLAGQLQDSGYVTAAFVAAPELNRSRNLQLGFDRYEAGVAESLPRAAERVAQQATEWIGAARQFEHPYFVWVHFPATSIESAPPLRGLALRELDEYVRGLVDAARGNEPEAAGRDRVSAGIAFAALSGTDKHVEARALDLARVRVPLIWSPPGGVVPQRLLAPVPLLDIAPTLLHSVGLAVPETFAGEGLRVGPLPPTAPRPARPLPLEAASERGLVLSRRYYVKPTDGGLGRTALLSNDGRLPTTRPVSTTASEVADHERLLEGNHGLAQPPAALDAPPRTGALDNSRAGVGNNFSSPEEEQFP